MPLSPRTGNMYEWVSHTWSCLRGECPHGCTYCYVKRGRWTKGSPEYRGPPRLEAGFDKIRLGRDRSIFVAHTSDLFASGVPEELVRAVLHKCGDHPQNLYVFQTKNPGRVASFLDAVPSGSIIGTTIETNSEIILGAYSKAPAPIERAKALRGLKAISRETFLTIEPIMNFGPSKLLELINIAEPSWVNIGADSKGCDLPEPTWERVQGLIDGIRGMGIEIREKSNLDRLRGRD